MFRAVLLFTTTCLLAIAFQPQSAHASCGDWLQHSIENPTGHAQIDFPISRDFPAVPCDGPNCQSVPVPAIPVSFADGKVTRNTQPLAVLRLQDHSIESELGYALVESNQYVLPGHLLPIERPPRV
ncbi:hypothetical protein [Rhodopirellula sp. MGV]|uniref:hypothetical protein n=1 Tax=Rhodopirellula sp. MGV TaxID=2023130 RepID=UPI000B95E6F1|nr:hypothetical protein [Rhodopirellula sp. MGV]OYP39128.1 hypothetical protein CGZ80_00315 [Rhodopirellula sp. MGV]PNY35494.1 hypothetical protein C2E31_18525 [Rhodopirellula baltica]